MTYSPTDIVVASGNGWTHRVTFAEAEAALSGHWCEPPAPLWMANSVDEIPAAECLRLHGVAQTTSAVYRVEREAVET